ncbi:hypothetical protein [Deinococcus sp. UYEF24]
MYSLVRVPGASLAVLASLGWLGDRIGWSNPLGATADRLGEVGPWALVGLAVLAASSFALTRRKATRRTA